MLVNRLNSSASDFHRKLETALDVAQKDSSLPLRVGEIIADVRSQGDPALLKHIAAHDHFEPKNAAQLRVKPKQFDQAMRAVLPETLDVFEQAAVRIRAYAERQGSQDWNWEENGVHVGQKVTPLDSVGLYIPGGKAVYPSSILMTAIPAQVAGVPRIAVALASPAGELNPLVLAVLRLCDIKEVYQMGGAHAIAALAYGTETIPKVDKIVGPGNRYVTEAKRQVFGVVGIDMLAGPTEIVVLADGSCRPSWVAADLLSQAEHDEHARAILISTDEPYLDAVEKAMERAMETLPRRGIIRNSLENHGLFIQVPDLEEGVNIVNTIAPEHLELILDQPQTILPLIRNAGAIFLGHYACEALGDYCAGPSHVLPTAGSARFTSPLSVSSFQKHSSVISCNKEGAASLAPIATRMAEEEGLFAHFSSVQCRTEQE